MAKDLSAPDRQATVLPRPPGYGRRTESEELLTGAEIATTLKMNQQAIRNWGGVWGGDVPVPVAPGESVQHKAAPPDAPRDAEQA